MNLRTLLCVAACAWAAAASGEPATGMSIDQLADLLPGVEREQVSESPIHGIYEVAVGTQVAYVSDDGRYLLQGELFDLDSNENLTEQRRSQARVSVLSSLAADQMIVFSPDGQPVKHSIVVFTDIDCVYCRRLHQQIQQINDLGIEVRYAFYPRSGPGTVSWQKAGNVWCAEDRHTALTKAKAGADVPANKCENTPIQAQYDVGQMAGVRGTPAIFTLSGEQIGGYLPADAMLARLESE
jgi:thiol:disulfide interchange protein DsbC